MVIANLTFVTRVLNWKFIQLSKMDKVLVCNCGNTKISSWWELKIFNKTWKLFKKTEICQPPTDSLSRQCKQCQDDKC